MDIEQKEKQELKNQSDNNSQVDLPVINFCGFNCSKAVPKICKADCCGIVPINHLVFHTMKDKIVTKPLEIMEMQMSNETLIFPITENGVCCFLGKDYKCQIYDYRPKICKDFGLIPELKCPHLTAEGDLRTKEDKAKVMKNMEVYRGKVINKLKDASKNL